jgi:hypothetical protein
MLRLPRVTVDYGGFGHWIGSCPMLTRRRWASAGASRAGGTVAAANPGRADRSSAPGRRRSAGRELLRGRFVDERLGDVSEAVRLAVASPLLVGTVAAIENALHQLELVGTAERFR